MPKAIFNSKTKLCPFQKRAVVLAIFLPGMIAFAQVGPGVGTLQNILEQQFNRDALQPQTQPATKTREEQAAEGEKNIEVTRFELRGNQLFSQARLDEVMRPWTGRALSFDELMSVTTALQEFYFQNGRLVQARIPQQEVSDGVVNIDILEAKMGSLLVEPQETPSRFSADRVKPYLADGADAQQFIQTRALERGLYLLNEVPGVRASGSFEPGLQAGTSNFRVKTEDTPWLSGQVGLSNHGSASTGNAQVLASLSLNNLSGSGNQATLDLAASRGSSYAQAGYNMPMGSDGWKLGLHASRLNYKTLAGWSATPTEGTASTAGVSATYALQRSQSANSNLRIGFDSRRYNSSQAGSPISDYRVNAITLGINGNWADADNAVMNYGVNLVSGRLHINNASQALQDSTGPASAGRYSRLGFNFSRNQTLGFWPNTSWLNAVNGQLASKNLNSSEALYLGGPYALRAYPTGQGAGSQGAVLTSELNHRINGQWQLGGFVDVGVVQQYVNTYANWQGLTHANNIYSLADVGLTARYTHDRLSIAAVVARRVGNNPLHNNSGAQLNADNAYRAVQAWVKATLVF